MKYRLTSHAHGGHVSIEFARFKFTGGVYEPLVRPRDCREVSNRTHGPPETHRLCLLRLRTFVRLAVYFWPVNHAKHIRRPPQKC
jgi:hypothetical protein